jgi:hypothetical protein
MDTEVCNLMNKAHTDFEWLSNTQFDEFDDVYKAYLIKIYKSIYTTEQNYINSGCPNNINDYLNNGSSELNKYELLNEEAGSLITVKKKEYIYKVISVILTVILIFLMQ